MKNKPKKDDGMKIIIEIGGKVIKQKENSLIKMKILEMKKIQKANYLIIPCINEG